MELTGHANQRILERTHMLTKDVVFIIQKGAVISLGVLGNMEYLLFYSPPDKDAKIAIVTKDRTTIISVWERNYKLPKDIRVTTKKIGKAKKKYQRLVFDLLAAQKKPPTATSGEEVGSTPHYEVEIEVLLDGRVVYSHHCEPITHRGGRRSGTARWALRKELGTLARLVEENQGSFEGKVEYLIHLFWILNRTTHKAFLTSHKKALALSHLP